VGAMRAAGGRGVGGGPWCGVCGGVVDRWCWWRVSGWEWCVSRVGWCEGVLGGAGAFVELMRRRREVGRRIVAGAGGVWRR